MSNLHLADTKRRWSIKTAGRWPWKSESAKNRVTTYLPNGPALKMDGAKVKHLFCTATLALINPSVASRAL